MRMESQSGNANKKSWTIKAHPLTGARLCCSNHFASSNHAQGILDVTPTDRADEREALQKALDLSAALLSHVQDVVRNSDVSQCGTSFTRQGKKEKDDLFSPLNGQPFPPDLLAHRSLFLK